MLRILNIMHIKLHMLYDINLWLSQSPLMPCDLKSLNLDGWMAALYHLGLDTQRAQQRFFSLSSHRNSSQGKLLTSRCKGMAVLAPKHGSQHNRGEGKYCMPSPVQYGTPLKFSQISFWAFFMFYIFIMQSLSVCLPPAVSSLCHSLPLKSTTLVRHLWGHHENRLHLRFKNHENEIFAKEDFCLLVFLPLLHLLKCFAGFTWGPAGGSMWSTKMCAPGTPLPTPLLGHPTFAHQILSFENSNVLECWTKSKKGRFLDQGGWQDWHSLSQTPAALCWERAAPGFAGILWA